MIQYLKRNQIDINKYDDCIENALNSRIYAFSWYLDIVADNWDVLVLNDYEAVMPLPWRRKYFIKYVYPPAWTQQLGVFSQKATTANLIQSFIKEIPRKFKKITIQFNSENDLSLFKTEKRVNYILDLNKPYEEIYSRYRKDRKKRLRQFYSEELEISNRMKFWELKSCFQKFYNQKLSVKNLDIESLKKLFFLTEKKGFQELKKVEIEKEFHSGLFALNDKNRITILFSATSINGFNSNSFTGIINEIIKNYSDSNLKLDFEGSMIPSIASFNKSFGSKPEDYHLYKSYIFFKLIYLKK